MAASMTMCLQALGIKCDEDEVNKVMGARPMKGAAWEQALACAQHYGAIATLRVPATVRQLKEWTDKGVAVMIAWNPHGRDWSHASVVFDVQEADDGSLTVFVADPNCPDPEQTVVQMPSGEFYTKWFEEWPKYLVRRPALAIEREISRSGRQMKASVAIEETPMPGKADPEVIADRYLAAKRQKSKTHEVRDKKDPNAPLKGKSLKQRSDAARDLAEGRVNIRPGPHLNKGQRGQGGKGKGKGQRHRKHKKRLTAAKAVSDRLLRALAACGDGGCTCGGSCGCGGTPQYPSDTPGVAEPILASPSQIAARYLMRGDSNV
jgi:hypothetical protein